MSAIRTMVVFGWTALSLTAMAYQTNKWQNAAGGKWSVDANWSLDRVPTYDDWVELPSLSGNYSIEVDGDYQVRCVRLEKTGAQTVTLTGNGSITSGINDCYVREERALILDGPSFIMTKANFMLYGPLTVKSGSVLNCVMATFWLTAPALHVESGGSAIFSTTVNVRAGTSVIDINGGTFQSPKITRSGTYTNCGSIRVSNNGSLSVQTLDLDNGSSVSVSSGSFSVSSAITMNGTVGLTLTGGTLTLPEGKVPQAFIDAVDGATVEYIHPTIFVDGPVTDRTVLETLGGDTLVVTSGSDEAVSLFTNNTQLDGVIEVDGMLCVTNGMIFFDRRGTMGGDYPAHVKAFKNGGNWPVPTLRFPEIVVGQAYPFVATSASLNTFYVEGPTTFRATADMDQSSALDTVVMASGDFVVDTRDFNDPSVVRQMALNGFGAKDAASLTVRGGGELRFLQAHSGSPFTKIEVESGTTLTLLPHLSATTCYGPLHADEFVLGPNTVLNIPAGSNAVHAARWSIDPTATINVIFAAGMPVNAFAAICDIDGGLTVPAGQIQMLGATEGWFPVSCNGFWAATNRTMDVSVESNYEWTGLGSDAYFDNPDNWAGRMKPLQTYNYVLGAADAGTTVKIRSRMYASNDIEPPNNKGGSIQSLRFRNTAVPSFTVYGEGNITFEKYSAYANAAISSFSPVPQFYIYNGIRAGSPTFCAAAEGPIVMKTTHSDFLKRNASGLIGVSGDVRFGALITFPQFKFDVWNDGYGHLTCGSCLTVLENGNVTFTNQATAFTVPYSGFRVKAGGNLTFNGGSAALYKWNSSTYGAKNTIDGTMNINVPLVAGNDHAFGGSGTLNLASVTPLQNTQIYANAGRSRVSFGDALNVNLSQDWLTAKEDADFPLTISAFGTPTIHLAANWRYGPAAGMTPTSTAANRAARVAKGAILTVDAGGHVATFADPVAGKGTLAITNGTLVTDGGVAETLGIVAKAGGVFEWGAAQSLRSVACEEGGALRFTAFGQPLTVKECVNLATLDLTCPADLDAGNPHWRTVIVSPAGFAGALASVPRAFATRIVETAEGWALQLRRVVGLSVSIR